MLRRDFWSWKKNHKIRERERKKKDFSLIHELWSSSSSSSSFPSIHRLFPETLETPILFFIFEGDRYKGIFSVWFIIISPVDKASRFGELSRALFFLPFHWLSSRHINQFLSSSFSISFSPFLLRIASGICLLRTHSYNLPQDMDRSALTVGPGMDIPIMHDSDRYELVRDIGSGNFGIARLMRDKQTGELVAVKYIERGEKVSQLVTAIVIIVFYLCKFLWIWVRIVLHFLWFWWIRLNNSEPASNGIHFTCFLCLDL